MDGVELYVNSVEYSSMAIIPIQLLIILLVKGCCCRCQQCKKYFEEPLDVVDKNKMHMDISKSEFTA